MLKVKVEPVEPTLYGKVSLPNNPLTIAGYQVFCNDDECHEEKVVEEDGEDEDRLSRGGDGEIEGMDRMMTDCCRENDLLGAELGSDPGIKDNDDIHIGGYVENDVMVDNNIVEEQVVEDSLVLVSPVMNESSSDSIQVPYMDTDPTEVLVIEEGAELMVENNNDIGYPHMIIDESREYLITSEDGEPHETLITDTDEHHIVDHDDMQFSQPDHVLVERISYEMPTIQGSTTQYYLQDDQPVDTRVQPGLNIEHDHLIVQPIVQPLEIIPQQKVPTKSKKTVKKENKVSEPSQKKKKAIKRKAGDKSNECTLIPQENATNKTRKKRKGEQVEGILSQKVIIPMNDQLPIADTQTTPVSPIQANHPTLSLLLTKAGPMELVGPVTEPAKHTLLKKQLFPNPGIDLTTPKSTNKSIVPQVKAKAFKSSQTKSIQFQAILPQVVTEINEAEEMVVHVPDQVLTNKPSIKKAMLKIPKSPIKQSKNSNNKHSKPFSKLVPSVPEVTPMSTQTVMKIGNSPTFVQMTVQPAEAVCKDSALRIKLAITQPTVSLMTPITVAVADNPAIASLPSAKSASVLTVPKPMRRLQVGQSPKSKSVPTIASPPIAAIPMMSTRAPLVSSSLSITVSRTPSMDVSTTVNTDPDSLVSPIQKKYQTVTTTLQTRLAAKPNSAPNGSETLADRYMKEWKPTGRFQCKLCLYSCVTHNFLFRHWVLNHCSLRPYMCGHCRFQSATRDGVTRHQTAKHRGLTRRIFIDNERQEELWIKFDEMFQGSGFVTELERKSQATYTLEHVSKAQHSHDAGQFSHKLASEAADTLHREGEVVGSTILKVPKREKVAGKFREMILSSSDDQDLGSSKETSEDDGEEEALIHRYYSDSESRKVKSDVIFPHNLSVELPVPLLASGIKAASDILPPSIQEEVEQLEEEAEMLQNEHLPGPLTTDKDGAMGATLASQHYEQCITSVPTTVHTSALMAQDSVDSAELLTAASEGEQMTAQVDTAIAIAQVSPGGEIHQEFTVVESRN